MHHRMSRAAGRSRPCGRPSAPPRAWTRGPAPGWRPGRTAPAPPPRRAASCRAGPTAGPAATARRRPPTPGKTGQARAVPQPGPGPAAGTATRPAARSPPCRPGPRGRSCAAPSSSPPWRPGPRSPAKAVRLGLNAVPGGEVVGDGAVVAGYGGRGGVDLVDEQCEGAGDAGGAWLVELDGDRGGGPGDGAGQAADDGLAGDGAVLVVVAQVGVEMAR